MQRLNWFAGKVVIFWQLFQALLKEVTVAGNPVTGPTPDTTPGKVTQASFLPQVPAKVTAAEKLRTGNEDRLKLAPQVFEKSMPFDVSMAGKDVRLWQLIQV